MTGEKHHEPSSHIVIPTSIFYILLASAGIGGFGVNPLLRPDPGREALAQCSSTADAALQISAQQSRYIADLQDKIADGTRDRHTKTQQQAHESAQSRRDGQQDRNIEYIEKYLKIR